MLTLGRQWQGDTQAFLSGFSRPVRDSLEIKEGAWDSRNYCLQLPHTREHMCMCPCTHICTHVLHIHGCVHTEITKVKTDWTEAHQNTETLWRESPVSQAQRSLDPVENVPWIWPAVLWCFPTPSKFWVKIAMNAKADKLGGVCQQFCGSGKGNQSAKPQQLGYVGVGRSQFHRKGRWLGIQSFAWVSPGGAGYPVCGLGETSPLRNQRWWNREADRLISILT